MLRCHSTASDLASRHTARRKVHPHCYPIRQPHEEGQHELMPRFSPCGLRGYPCASVVMLIFSHVCFSMPRGTPAHPAATRPPAAARSQWHARPTCQPTVSPAKEEAPRRSQTHRTGNVKSCSPWDGLLRRPLGGRGVMNKWNSSTIQQQTTNFCKLYLV